VEATNNKISEVLDILTARQDNIEQLTKQICYISSTIVELQKLENMLNKIANGK
jgi:prefoldin subunit 5